jgi:hypothetical protein
MGKVASPTETTTYLSGKTQLETVFFPQTYFGFYITVSLLIETILFVLLGRLYIYRSLKINFSSPLRNYISSPSAISNTCTAAHTPFFISRLFVYLPFPVPFFLFFLVPLFIFFS